MKYLFSFICFTTIIHLNSHSQSASKLDILNQNNIGMLIYSNGALSTDTFSFLPGFEVPRGSGKHGIYSTDLIIVGKNTATNKTHIISSLYKSNQLSEGAVASNYNSSWNFRYNRMWRIKKKDIDNHIQKWNTPGYAAIPAISNWPAHGDTSNGESRNLAPFVDLNSNGIYEPYSGDYPCIKGDLAIYTIANDDKNPPQFPGTSFSFEIHLMAYSFSSTDAINNTVFLEYTIYNRSQQSYEDVYLGMFQDYDIGCSSNDYVGCDTNLNSFYAYNGTSFDMDCNGALGYYNLTPVVGTVFLNQPMTSFMRFNNLTGPRGFPQTSADFYHYSKAEWKDGTHLVEGGNGYPGDIGASNNSLNFIFPGDVNDTTTWSEVSVSNKADERSGYAASGPYTINPSESIKIDLAIIYSQDSTKNNFENVDIFKNDVSVVQQFYDNQNFNCPTWLAVRELPNSELSVKLYPNPASNEVFIEWSANDNVTAIYSFDSNGRKIFEYTPKDENTLRLTSDKWTKGLYLIKIESEKGIAVRKLVVE